MSNNTTIQEVESALHSIPPDLPRKDWVKTGMAIKSEFGDAGFAPWDNWSQGGGSYNKKDAADVWKSIKPAVGGKSVGIGSLFMMAKNHGYKPATSRTVGAGGVKKAKPLPTHAPANKIDQSALAKAQERWDSAQPVPADYHHPYLKAKQVPAYGLRVDANGNLLTPMYQDGKFSCYQAISPVLGEKKPNAPGVSLNEAYFMMGDIASARRVFIAEGYATGATVHMVTGDPVAVSFGAGRLKLVAMDISRKYPGVQIVMAADDDAGGNSNPGLDAAQVAAKLVGGLVAVPDFGDDRPEGATDFNDLMLCRGKDAVLDSLNAAADVDDGLPPLTAITFDELNSATTTPRSIVPFYLYEDVRIRIAAGGTGKTTVALYEAMQMALGVELWGRRLGGSMKTLIVTKEDQRKILVGRLRDIMVAHELSHDEKRTVLENVMILDLTEAHFRLTHIIGDVVEVNDDAIDSIVRRTIGFKPDWIIFDPLVSFGVGESRVNDAEQGMIESFRYLMKRIGCCVEGIHHTGKANARDKTNDQYSGRGGSALADGSRMVAVLNPVDAQEWNKVCDRPLRLGETGIVMTLPKLSYCVPQDPIYIRRNGFHFEHEVVVKRTNEQMDEALMNQVYQFIFDQFNQHPSVRYNKTELETQKDKMDISRDKLRQIVIQLIKAGRVVYHSAGQGKSGSYYEPVVESK